MRAAELYETGRFRIVERPLPDPAPGQVQVRIEAVGICGSDLHYFSEGSIGDTPCVFPMVLGHEPAGTVIGTGAGAGGWQPGDRAMLEPALYCYHCEFCRTGRHNICEKIRFLSNPGEPGFFRDRVNLPLSNLLPIPASMSYAEATLVEPLAVALHSLDFVNLKFGQSVAVFGAGPIGLLTIAALRLSGAGRIFAVEPVAHRRELALAMGADEALDPAQGDTVREILAGTHGKGVDASIDCAAKGVSTDRAVHASRAGGRVVVTAIPSEVHIPLPFHEMRRKETALFHVRRSNHESETALDWLRREPRRFAPVLTHTRPLERIAEAFDIASRYADGVGKMIVTS